MLKHPSGLVPLDVMRQHKGERCLAQFSDLAKRLWPTFWLQCAIVNNADRVRQLLKIHRASPAGSPEPTGSVRQCHSNPGSIEKVAVRSIDVAFGSNSDLGAYPS